MYVLTMTTSVTVSEEYETVASALTSLSEYVGWEDELRTFSVDAIDTDGAVGDLWSAGHLIAGYWSISAS